MNKVLFKFLNLTEKLHLIVYQIIIVFALFFYVVLKGSTGHKFIITDEEIIYSIILFFSFVLSGIYKERKKFGAKVNKVILCLFLASTTVTFGMALYFLCFTFTFDYGFNEEIIFILLIFFFLPILFTWFNYYLIKK